LFTFIAKHPAVPHILSAWLILIFYIIALEYITYAVFLFFSAMSDDPRQG
jgi:hypothetical protein